FQSRPRPARSYSTSSPALDALGLQVAPRCGSISASGVSTGNGAICFSVIRTGKTNCRRPHLAGAAFALLIVRNHIFESPMHGSHERADAPRVGAGEYLGAHQI